MRILLTLNKTLTNDVRTYQQIEEDVDKNSNNADKSDNNIDYPSSDNDSNYDIPTERDLRDPQPTISVNYRVIKDNEEKDFRDKNQKSYNTQYDDDWSNNNSEW